MRYFLLTALLTLALSIAMAGGTQIWETLTVKDFESGTFQRTVLLSDATVRMGHDFVRIECPQPMLWSHGMDEKKRLYLGTGTRGIVYRLENEGLVPYADTEQLAVTALVSIGETIYAGTIPEGKIFRIQEGKLSLLATLPSPYVWALESFQGKLYAATGPKGTLYQIDIVSGEIKTVLEVEEKHLLCMDVDENGNLYVGSAPQAILYKISPSGEAIALLSLPENEIRALAVCGGKIYLGANQAKGMDNSEVVKNLAQNVKQQAEKGKPVERKKLVGDMLSAVLYEYTQEKGLETLLKLEKNFITSLALEKKSVLCSTGIEGRVYRVKDKDTFSILCDLKEDQVMTLVVDEGSLAYVGTGDNGKLYKVSPFRPESGVYHSPVYDAGALSLWGMASWEKEGNLALQIRTGNTKKPDKFWYSWGPIQEKEHFRIANPPARYIQYRVVWSDPDAFLKKVCILYKPQNRAPEIASFTLNLPSESNRKLFPKEKANPVEFNWKASDPEKDNLRYRLFYRNVKFDPWYEITAGQVFTQTKYKWDISHVPDGYYIIKFIASDELENASPGQAIFETRPVLIDNQPPVVSATLSEGKVRGSASDSFSCITQIGYRAHGQDWTLIEPLDNIFDSQEEMFEFRADFPKEAILEIKAVDGAGNIGYVFVK